MKKTLLYLILATISFQVDAQNLISTSGTSVQDANTKLAYSIGETVVTTYTQGSDQITQGFHQGNTTVSFTSENQLELQLFPNPNNGVFFLSKKDLQPLSYKLFTIEGVLLNSGAFTSLRKEFDLSAYANGNYLLEVLPLGDKTQKTILKINKTN
ncbi:T9SS type A sorting domain-containing protein [Parvicella tangerina]|uniref:Secretion system C-terminal sorting domain-containing protein n=1 Tax=Parvicella tangerina TaxID=2829795 RepID=A0A916JJA4_9FLAO|nr:T9SS type A sorting domain-containing protein [Parvicella tangerina]CAG5077065.1 hypothetical protein CRYO30217_00281 [Parvicella tangerina]